MSKKDKTKKREEIVRKKRLQLLREESRELAQYYLEDAKYAFQARHYPRAKALAEKAKRINPQLLPVYYLLADIYQRLGESHNLIAVLHKIRESDPDDEIVLYQMIYTYYNLKQFKKALEVWEEWISKKGEKSTLKDKKLEASAKWIVDYCRLNLQEGEAKKPPQREAIQVPSSLPSHDKGKPSQEYRRLSLSFSFEGNGVLQQLRREAYEPLALYNLRTEAQKIFLIEGYDSLLCINTLKDVQHYWFQIETVKKVLKYFRGRVILCDEVGLGKTIEAGMLLKEYMLRGLVRKVLILTPPSLISQWKEEMETKFGLNFVTTDDPAYTNSPLSFWQDNNLIIASINIAKSQRNFEVVTNLEHDLVVIDEAHHLKNRATLNWKLANALKKKFIFLLTATPVQNDLMELYNLITLLRPGTLKTPAYFRKEFMKRGDPRLPQNREQLRLLLKEVTIRNTRSLADINLPKRYASTVMVHQDEEEKEIYQRISQFVRKEYPLERNLPKFTLNLLQMEAGSSPFALRSTLSKILENNSLDLEQRKELEEIMEIAQGITRTQKAVRLLETLRASPVKKIVFTKYLETQNYLCQTLRKEDISFATLSGNMSNAEKDEQVLYFKDKADLIISTESGAEGKNFQFCNTMINFDLPWNPMRIEQRIGRIHRIGQQRDVFIFNFCGKDTVEDYLLYLLDKKINMFELVIGEMDMILGYLRDEREFPDIIMDMWIRSATLQELEHNFTTLGEKLLEAREGYLKTKEYDDQLFSRDFEV